MNTTIHGAAERPLVADQLAILVRRNLRTSARVPQLLMFSLTMPMAMLVLFSQVFRSVADSTGFPSGVSYIDFLTPAMLAVSTVMAGTNAGVAAAIDHTNGLHERFGTLPMSARLPGVARTINEVLFTLVRAALLLAAAVALGFRFHGDLLDAVTGLAVLVTLAAAMSALFGRLGDHLRRPDVVQFAGMMIMMPFMFVSGAFAPLATMPGRDAGRRRREPRRTRDRRAARQRPRHRQPHRSSNRSRCRRHPVGCHHLHAALAAASPCRLTVATAQEQHAGETESRLPESNRRPTHCEVDQWGSGLDQ